MDVSSSLTGTKEFRIVKRGYDPDEVNAFLDQIALGVGELKRKLAEAEDTAAAARTAAAAPKAAPAPAPSAAADAQAEEIHRALILAQRAADEEVRKATEEGQALVASARQQAEALRAEVEAELARRREDGRADLLAEIDELERVRDSLSNDVVVLERHVEEQREVVQAAIGELQSLLDHPEAFRIATETGVSTTPPAVDRGPTSPPAAVPAPDDVAPPAGDEAGEELPGRADLSAALAWAAADEEPEAESAPPRSDGTPPAAPSADDRPPRPTPPTAEDTVSITSPPPAPPGDLFAGPPGGDEDDRDLGPPTEAVATVGPAADPEEDAFLAELRKAMLDDEPLGPRRTEDPGLAPGVDDDAGRGRPRFGRRR